MFSGCVAYSAIKDLKDLSIHRTAAFYRHAGPKDLKRCFLRRSNDREGQALALRARGGFSSPCAVREQALPNYSFLLIVIILEIV